MPCTSFCLLQIPSDAGSLTGLPGESGERVKDFRMAANRQTRDEKMSDLHAANDGGYQKGNGLYPSAPIWENWDSRSVQDLQTGEDRQPVFYQFSVSGFCSWIGGRFHLIIYLPPPGRNRMSHHLFCMGSLTRGQVSLTWRSLRMHLAPVIVGPLLSIQRTCWVPPNHERDSYSHDPQSCSKASQPRSHSGPNPLIPH